MFILCATVLLCLILETYFEVFRARATQPAYILLGAGASTVRINFQGNLCEGDTLGGSIGKDFNSMEFLLKNPNDTIKNENARVVATH